MSQSIYPVVRHRDSLAAIEWLESVLGFERGDVHLGDDGTVQHAQLLFEGTMIMLGTGDPVGTPYLAASDVDGLHARASSAGADVTDIVEQDYGSRDFGVTDPEGPQWWIGSYRPN